MSTPASLSMEWNCVVEFDASMNFRESLQVEIACGTTVYGFENAHVQADIEAAATPWFTPRAVLRFSVAVFANATIPCADQSLEAISESRELTFPDYTTLHRCSLYGKVPPDGIAARADGSLARGSIAPSLSFTPSSQRRSAHGGALSKWIAVSGKMT
ncbi:hypothetical protein [Bradyrhizobium sp. USDA 223]|uniref:hypothetical protein n=1 Tax=Bradyrhizobium sp. USDA 223 TaxID=3156306 RepID=UPI003835E332